VIADEIKMLGRYISIFDHRMLFLTFPGSSAEKMSELSVTEDQDDESDNCVTKEQVIDQRGGEIRFSDVELVVPPNSVTQDVPMSVSVRDFSSKQRRDIEKTGLQDKVQPGKQIQLETHGQTWQNEVLVKLKIEKPKNDAQLMIFHKNDDKDAQWTDITEDCNPEVHEDSVILKIKRKFSNIQTVWSQLKRSIVKKLLNGADGDLAACDIYVYYNNPRPLQSAREPLIAFVHTQNVTHKHNLSSEYLRIGHNASQCSLVDGERLQFFYGEGEDQLQYGAQFDLCLRECREEGQMIKLPALRKVKHPPDFLSIYRKMEKDHERQLLFEIELHDRSR